MYSIESGDLDSKFRMDSSSGDLLLIEELDFETASLTLSDQYVLSIIAVDSDPTTTKTGTIEVRVTVTDVNDNDPVCTPVLYSHTLSEANQISNIALLSLTCTDAESNTNLNYSISSVTSNGASITSPFTIDNSGAIRLQAITDYETDQAMTVLVEVEDNGAPSRTVTATVEFDLTNFNDNNPTFNPIHHTTSIIETTAVGTKIYTVAATDADVLDSITYKLNPVIDEFQIDPNSGEIFLKQAVNYDSTDKIYELIVEATDDGTMTGQKTGTATVTVSITNFNDGTPEFIPGVYVASVNENEANSYLVTTVTVTDIDDTTFTYDIQSGNNDKIFTITGSTNTATITVSDKTKLDFDTTTLYELVINATDTGGLFGTATVNIEITNYNEHAPAFTTTQNSENIPEDASVGNMVIDIDANDDDAGLDGEIVYSFVSGAQGKFAIDSKTGVVTVSGALDIETTDGYTLVIAATDGGTNPSKLGLDSVGKCFQKLLKTPDI